MTEESLPKVESVDSYQRETNDWFIKRYIITDH